MTEESKSNGIYLSPVGGNPIKHSTPCFNTTGGGGGYKKEKAFFLQNLKGLLTQDALHHKIKNIRLKLMNNK